MSKGTVQVIQQYTKGTQRRASYCRSKGQARVAWKAGLTLLAGMAAITLASSSQAQSSYHITLATAPLAGHPAAPFSLDFQLTDGSGEDPADGNNVAVISNFVFGSGGSASGASVSVGSVQGDLTHQLTLTDGMFLNDFQQTFVPGDVLSFDLTLTGNADTAPGAVPDEFSFAILDGSGAELPTQGLSAVGSDVFLTMDITGASPSLEAFGSDSTRSPQAGGPTILLNAPQVTRASPVPEADTAALLGPGLVLLGVTIGLRKSLSWKSNAA